MNVICQKLPVLIRIFKWIDVGEYTDSEYQGTSTVKLDTCYFFFLNPTTQKFASIKFYIGKFSCGEAQGGSSNRWLVAASSTIKSIYLKQITG